MCSTKNRRSVCITYLSILGVLGFATFVYTDDVEDLQTLQTASSDGEAFSVMDAEAMRAYRDDRHETLVEALTRSNLSTEHQKLVANAMAKTYVGIPVSSYTYTSRFNQGGDYSNEIKDNYYVRVAGHIQRENVKFTQSLNNASPFKYFPPVPFVSETGKLLHESESAATFEFKLKHVNKSVGEFDMMFDEAKKMKWLFEITVNTDDQAPERLSLKLAKPVRKRFLFILRSFQMDFDFSFIESCGCFAISRMNMEMKGSAIIVRRLDQSVELTNTDISCDQPVQFLLPDERDSGLRMF